MGNFLLKTCLLLLVVSTTSFANAQQSCRALITSEPTVAASVAVAPRTAAEPARRAAPRDAIEKFKVVDITASEKTALSRIVREHNIGEFADVAEMAAKLGAKIKEKAGEPAAKSNELAEISDKVYAQLERRIKKFFQDKNITRAADQMYNFSKSEMEQYIAEKNPSASDDAKKALVRELQKEYDGVRLDLMKAKYSFSEQIAKIEQFDISEYEPATSHPLINNQNTHVLVSLSEYPSFAMALARDMAPPRPYGPGGVVSFKEYRDCVAMNLWLFTLEGHDLKHIHFANAHPMAGAAMFRLTRSKNHLRYFLVAALYEGVDTVQYGFESALARHFSEQGMSLEQAMIHLASAPQAELREIAIKIGKNPDYGDSQLSDWKPSLIAADQLPSNATTPEKLEQDILKFFKKSLADLANPAINIYMRPELVDDGIMLPAGTHNKPGEEIHHY